MLKKSKSTDKTKDSSIISQSTSNHENKNEQSFITVVNSEAQRRIRQRFSAQKRLAMQMGQKPKGLADNEKFELEWTKDSYGLEGDPKSIQKRAETIVETDYREIQSLKKWMNNLKEKTHLSYLDLNSPSKDKKAIQLATQSVLQRNLSLPIIEQKTKDVLEAAKKQSQFSQGSRYDRRKTTGPVNHSHQAFMSMVNYENEESESSHMDFSIDGIKRLYETLIKLNRSDFDKEVDRANFYKKQTDLVLTKLQQKIENDIKYRRKVQGTLEQKLKENHDIYTKINQVNDLIETLDQEATKIKQKPLVEKNQSKQSSSKMIMDTIGLKQQQQQQLLQNQQDQDILRESLQNYRNKHRTNKNQIEQLEKFVFIKNKAIKQLKNSQLLFLHHVLEMGMDCRQEGLVWLILKIKKYDSLANLELPLFLDNKAQQFLIKKSEIIAQVEKLRRTQRNLYEDYQKSREDSSSVSRSIQHEINFQESQITSKDGLNDLQVDRFSLMNLDQIKEGILQSKQTKAQQSIEGDLVKYLNTTLRNSTEKLIHQLKCQSVNLTKNDLVYLESKKRLRKLCLQNNNPSKSIECLNAEKDISKYNQIEQQMINLNTELEALEKVESQRISKEFQCRSYQKRFSITQSIVLAALFGAPKADRELLQLRL